MADIINKWAGVQEVSWTPVLENTLTFGSHYKIVPTEGYIAWEYNPLRNYRLSQNMYEKDGKYYTEKEFLAELGPNYSIKNGNLVESDGDTKKESTDLPSNWTLREAGELVDFITNELSFNIEHPVDIVP